jgi:hypothetical protein
MNSSKFGTSPKSANPLVKTPAAVARGLIMICEKCGKKLSSDPDENISRRMQKDLKHDAIEKFGAKQVRAVVSSCFDICPKDQITACVIRFGEPTQKAEFFVFNPEDVEAAKKALLSKF